MRLAQSWTIEPEHIVIEPESVATDTVDQKFWLLSNTEKNEKLLKLLETNTIGQTIVFANRRDETHSLTHFLKSRKSIAKPSLGTFHRKKAVYPQPLQTGEPQIFDRY